MKRLPIKTEVDCRTEIERMLKNSQTKVIMPAVAFGVLRYYLSTKQTVLGDTEVRHTYEEAVRFLKKHLGMIFTLVQSTKTPTGCGCLDTVS
jgi:phage gp36-like protein